MFHQTFRLSALFALCLTALTSLAQAALTTNPYLFTDQAVTSTGKIEWDEFAGSTASPFLPDVSSTGVSTAELTAGGGFTTSTRNIYSGGGPGNYAIDLQGVTTTDVYTTVVFQFAHTEGQSEQMNNVLLNGAAPTEFVNRSKTAVAHGPSQVGFVTRYYWAEWQTPAASSYTLSLGHGADHISFAQARVDYYNSATQFDAVAPANVPEPASMALALVGLCGWRVLRRRAAR